MMGRREDMSKQLLAAASLAQEAEQLRRLKGHSFIET
jgi:hypothetical protein